MDNNTAYGYKLDDEYTSIYVNLNGYDQLIFYWSLKNDCQRRKPKWRTTKETVEEGMKIIAYNHFGCQLEIDGKLARFEWYEYDNPKNNPAHKGKLINWADWATEKDPDYHPTSPTDQGRQFLGYYTGNYIGHYDRPLEEE